MKLTAASAMTLLLTDLTLYAAPEAATYVSSLDLSPGIPIITRLKPPDRSYLSQMMTIRKQFLLNEATNFLEALDSIGKHGQVVMMAAGASPLSIQLAATFSTAQIWDVGNYFMKEKAEQLGGKLANIHFIESEITDIDDWSDRLHFTGFDPTLPSLFVLESMYIYMKPEEMKSIVCKAKEMNAIMCGDYMINPGKLIPMALDSLKQLFDALQGIADLNKMRSYSRLEFATLLDTCGYRDLRFFPLSAIQRERTGDPAPFMNESGSPIEMWAVR